MSDVSKPTKKRHRTQSKEVKINKKYKECREDIYENTGDSSESTISDISDTEEHYITIETKVPSKILHLKILREP